MKNEFVQRSLFAQEFLPKVGLGQSLLLESLTQPMKAFVLTMVQETIKRPILVITGAGQEEWTFKNDLEFFKPREVIELPSWETLPSEGILPSPEIIGARFQALEKIKASHTPLILSTIQGALQKVIEPIELSKIILKLTKGLKYSFQKLQEQLVELGYEKKSQVCDRGEFAVRGGIIDVLPVQLPYVVRLEFFGDTIESIRSVDQITQKSTGKLDSVDIVPAQEVELLDRSKRPAPLFEYLPKDLLIVLDDVELLEDRATSLMSIGAKGSPHFLSIAQFIEFVHSFQTLYLTKNALESISGEECVARKRVKGRVTPVSLSFFNATFKAERWDHTFETLEEYFLRESLVPEEQVHERLLDCYVECASKVACTFLVQTQVEEESLTRMLQERGVQDIESKIQRGYLSSGFSIRDPIHDSIHYLPLLYFPMTELTGRVKMRKEVLHRSFSPVTSDVFDLVAGDPVVHFNHGIGRFLGVETKKNIHNIDEEYFSLEYANNSRLYVPLHQAHFLSKYIGSREETPQFHVLGTNKWQRIREKTEREVIGYADKLLKAYATRAAKGGYSFEIDSKLMKQFEDEFAYVETEDQLKAIAAVKQDMCSQKAMDRLICGDVGYGKTEVAMRAAFKAVVDGRKQVAVLVPTTVLAMQHYDTFSERMSPFGIRLGVLSRFRTPKETKQTLKALEEGQVDIVVGTHKLVQKEIQFRDLGLIIIDEEQRFGVKAKEHLKLLKEGVDCLTLSATPIPRTLYMSLVGARDLSTIATPPQERVPIKTVIVEPNEQLIQTALQRELNREGQAYFIHNRVDTIFDQQERLQRLVPRARIAAVHGQMSADEIDTVFHAFKHGQIDILVATSIIESGIDIPNANTIIVDRADMFGIADLYQLRGRVGRWNRRAFAYFLIPKSRVLSDISRRRIEAIATAGGWGGGFKVAMRDLELRGAGDILGLEQSGHVATVGFHLYCKLLKRAVETLQGKAPSYSFDVKIETPFNAKFPEHYVNDVQLRCELYQRLGEATSLEEVNALFEEVVDRFGTMPEPALWLRAISRIRVMAAMKGVTLIKVETQTVVLERRQGSRFASLRRLLPRVHLPDAFQKALQQILDSLQ